MKLPQTVRWATGIRWQWKVFIPIIAVLALSLVVVTVVLRSLEIQNAQWILLAALGFAILLCFVLLSVLLVLVERPLEELMETIERVRHGDLSTRVGFAKRDDDIGRLGQLAAGLAHEIRNPLAGIAGVVDVMSKDLPANSPSRAVTGDVQKEIRHIQDILNDLLFYARPRPPAFRPSDLNTTIEQAVMLARQQVRNKPVQILFAPNPSLPLVDHDPALIQQVVLNLLLNGIQAISGAGKVELTTAREQDQAIVEVSDTGKGIPADALPKIFKPFFTTRSEGTGLGLSLANGIVQSHGGTIEVSSASGKGSRFRIELPLERPKKDRL
jgi:signal transduction histidine kinase